MQVTIEIDEKTISKVDAVSSNRTEFLQMAIEEKLKRDEKSLSYDEKVKRTVESYKKFPQQPVEYEIWLDEQVWEDE